MKRSATLAVVVAALACTTSTDGGRSVPIGLIELRHRSGVSAALSGEIVFWQGGLRLRGVGLEAGKLVGLDAYLRSSTLTVRHFEADGTSTTAGHSTIVVDSLEDGSAEGEISTEDLTIRFHVLAVEVASPPFGCTDPLSRNATPELCCGANDEFECALVRALPP